MAACDLNDVDWKLLSDNLDGDSPWLRREVPAAHVMNAARQLRVPVTRAAQRLNDLSSTLALLLRPAVAFVMSQDFETLTAEVARMSVPAPYETFDARICTALWALQAGRNVNEGVLDSGNAILCAGRWWLWWLSDDEIRVHGEALAPSNDTGANTRCARSLIRTRRGGQSEIAQTHDASPQGKAPRASCQKASTST